MVIMHAELSASTQRTFGKPIAQMIDESPDAVAICSDNNYVLFVTENACHLLGMKREQMINHPCPFAANGCNFKDGLSHIVGIEIHGRRIGVVVLATSIEWEEQAAWLVTMRQLRRRLEDK